MLVYLVEDSISPCKSSHLNSQFLLNLWYDKPSSPPHAFHYFADFDPVEQKL